MDDFSPEAAFAFDMTQSLFDIACEAFLDGDTAAHNEAREQFVGWSHVYHRHAFAATLH